MLTWVMTMMLVRSVLFISSFSYGHSYLGARGRDIIFSACIHQTRVSLMNLRWKREQNDPIENAVIRNLFFLSSKTIKKFRLIENVPVKI